MERWIRVSDRQSPPKGIWYLRKVASSYKQFGLVSIFLRPKYIKFGFRNLWNGREDRNERR